MLSLRVASSVVFFILFFLSLFHPWWGWALPIMVAAAALKGIDEFTRFGGLPRRSIAYAVAMLGTFALLADAYWFRMRYGFMLLGVASVATLGLGALFARGALIDQAGRAIMGLLYVALPLSLTVLIWRAPVVWNLDSAPHYVVFLVAVTWATDIGAYFSGRAFGRHKLAPNLSPGKTIEGLAGGIVLTILTAVLMKLVWDNIDRILNWPEVLGLALAFSIIGTVGDLSESRLKRDAHIKDSGETFTGHGGILDIIDSLLFTSVVYYAYLWLFRPEVVGRGF